MSVLLPSLSAPSLPSLETSRPHSSSSPSNHPLLPTPSLAYSASVSDLPAEESSPTASSSSTSPLRSIVYTSAGGVTSTGLLCSLHSLYFVLTSSRALPSPSSALHCSATLAYQTSSSLRLSLDPSLFFYTSPPSSLDFSVCAISQPSYNALEASFRLSHALDLSEYVDKAELHRHMALTIHQHPAHSPLHSMPGYFISLFNGWCAYSAPCHGGCHGGIIATPDGALVGLHRARNDSRRWCEGSLFADIVPQLSPYLLSVKVKSARQSWLPQWILSKPAPPSPERSSRTLTPPASPKGEVMLLPHDKRRVDRIALLVVLAFLMYWVGELALSSLTGRSSSASAGGGLLGDRWLLNGVGVGVIVVAHFAAYAGYKRWRSG